MVVVWVLLRRDEAESLVLHSCSSTLERPITKLACPTTTCAPQPSIIASPTNTLHYTTNQQPQTPYHPPLIKKTHNTLTPGRTADTFQKCPPTSPTSSQQPQAATTPSAAPSSAAKTTATPKTTRTSPAPCAPTTPRKPAPSLPGSLPTPTTAAPSTTPRKPKHRARDTTPAPAAAASSRPAAQATATEAA